MKAKAYTYFVRPREGDEVVELEADTHFQSFQGYLQLQAYDDDDNLQEDAGFDKPQQWWRLPHRTLPPQRS